MIFFRFFFWIYFNTFCISGIITKTYNQGSYIPVIVDITANHQGYFIFKICPNNDIFFDPEQDCFDAHPLWVGGGDAQYNHTRFPIHDYETGLRMVYVRLPMEITCNQCILQWTYVAGKFQTKKSDFWAKNRFWQKN